MKKDTIYSDKKTLYKLFGFSFLLFVLLSGTCCHAGGQGPEKEDDVISSHMDYENSLRTFKTITEGMGQEEVARLLGTPDRKAPGDPDETWYEESWTYDFRKRAGYPRSDTRRAAWKGNIMFLNGKVVHTRVIGWLE